ncbi:PREDICTED: myb-related transcription factor, partner of profilin-like [Wasmannia auropunctata]|uniref:myb-related transcription factor, partner of profilin-like n=1 Tax=Wasmannia auropunctata TaxID=64793 RepID=UPI0005EFD783|nr:PREDICTED: myb-related transcription factor, partner of profilin-like [Wasmannia auropunctata]
MVAIRGREPEERWASGTGQSARAIRNPLPRPCARPRSSLGVVAYPRPSSPSSPPPPPSSSIRRTIAIESRRCVGRCAFLASAAAVVVSRAARSRCRARSSRGLLRVLPPDSRTITESESSASPPPSSPPPPLSSSSSSTAACIPPPIRLAPLSRRHRRRAEAPREPSRGSCI